MIVTVNFRNDNPDTIWNRLAVKLGREPTHDEAKQEVFRILRGVRIENAAKGQSLRRPR